MINSVWNLCRVTCPALPYDAKLEAKKNSSAWNQSTANAKAMDIYSNKKDHLVIATQPKNHVVNRAVNPIISKTFPDSSSLEPINSLKTSDITLAAGLTSITSTLTPSDHRPGSTESLGNFGSRKKPGPCHYINRPGGIDLRDVSGFDLRSKSEERGSVSNGPGHLLSSINPTTVTATANQSSALLYRSRSAEPTHKMETNDLSGHETSYTTKSSSASTEYRSAFNWPPGGGPNMNGSLPTVTSNGPYHQTGINGMLNGSSKKSQTFADFNEITAGSSMAPGPAGVPSTSGAIKSRPQVLFQTTQPPPEVKPITKTEYKKKFKPFSTYVYVPGNGWKKTKKLDKDKEIAMEWYNEVVERAKKASEFRSRSQFGHPIVGVDHLEEIYRETSSNLWNQPRDRSIAALALATTQLRIADRSSRDSSRESSKAGSMIDKASNHLSAIISPQKEPSNRKQFADRPKVSPPKSAAKSTAPRKPVPAAKPKSLTEKKKIGPTTPGSAKPSSGESEGGKIWLKPKKEPAAKLVEKPIGDQMSPDLKSVDGDKKESDEKLQQTAQPQLSNGEKTCDDMISPKEASDDQPKSPRPNSLGGSITNGGSDFPSPVTALPDGPVKTTEIKSPEEVTGVKSPSPELWRVQVETGADLAWTEAKPPTGSSDDQPISVSSLKDQCDSADNSLPSGSNVNEDLYGPLSI